LPYLEIIMDFFTHQDQARKRTSQLVLLFAAAVTCLVVLLNILVAALLWFTDSKLIGTYSDVTELAFDPSTGMPVQPGLFDYMNVEQWLIISAAVVAVVVIASLWPSRSRIPWRALIAAQQ
jgi:heme/copper-type cytochrome/quinol oxidase subunit 4